MRKHKSLWGLIRAVLIQGAAIENDLVNLDYELYSARLDEAAREREKDFEALLDNPWVRVEEAPEEWKDHRYLEGWFKQNSEPSEYYPDQIVLAEYLCGEFQCHYQDAICMGTGRITHLRNISRSPT